VGGTGLEAIDKSALGFVVELRVAGKKINKGLGIGMIQVNRQPVADLDELEIIDDRKQQPRADSGKKIEEKKAFRPPSSCQEWPENQQPEHVAKHMSETGCAVQEHIADVLKRPVFRRKKRPECKSGRQVETPVQEEQ